MPPRSTQPSELMDFLRPSDGAAPSSTQPSGGEAASDDEGGSLAEITSPSALRDLVLGYLVHHSYIETALAFASASEGGHDASHSAATTTAAGQSGGGPVASLKAAQHMIRGESGAEMEVELSDMLAVNGNGAANGSAAAASNGNGDASAAAAATATTSASTKGKAVAVEEKGVGELSAKDIEEIRVRKEIRDHILAGRIYAAIELCDVHFPTVLTTSDLPEPVASRGTNGASSSSSSDKSRPSLPCYASSLDGAHLALNLQIQAFIEAVRGASKSATSTSGNTGEVTQTAAANAAAAAGVSPSALRAASPSTFSDSGTSSTASLPAGPGASTGAPGIFESLELVQGINARVQKLPEYWRAMYLKELEGVTALLAYEDLERSPVRRFLDQSRRSALAEQVNSAILLRTGHPSQPLLESAVRQTTFVWGRIAADRVPVPANHPVLTSGSAAGGAARGVMDDAHTSMSDDPRKNRGRYLPPWELHNFLAER